MNTRISLLLVMALLFGLMTACSDDSDPAPADGDTDTVDTQEDGDSADDIEDEQDIEPDGDTDSDPVTEEEELVDQEPVDYTCPGGVKVLSIEGSAIDEAGAPISGAITIACLDFPDGGAACLNPVWSGSDGVFSIPVPEAKQCVSHVAIRALTGQEDKLILACPVDIGTGGNVVMADPMRIHVMPEPTRQTLGDETQPHTVSIADGTTLTIIPEAINSFEYGYEQTRLLTWDADSFGWPCFVDSENPPVALVALLPEVNIDQADGAHMTFPNTANLAPDAEVTVFALGGVGSHLPDGTVVKEGSWVRVSTGTVSADGATVSTNDGEGLPFLTWVGYYLQP